MVSAPKSGRPLAAPEKPPAHDARDCEGVRQDSGDAAQDALRFVEHAELAQHRRAIVIDPFAGEPVRRVEREDAAEREFDRAAGRWQAPPGALVPPRNDGLQNDRVLADVTLLD